ncbi:MAG: NAD(P)H-binding protein [Alphaproteobacteria bacterium]
MSRTALLAGATGLVGGFVLDALLNDPAYDRVSVIGRRDIGRRHPKLTVHIVDFGRLADHAEAIVGDDVFCALGSTIRNAGTRRAFYGVDHDHVIAAAKYASAGGARRMAIVSSVGASVAARTFYLRTKGEMERDVAALGYAQVDIFRPGLLLGPRTEFRPAERLGTLLAPVIGPLMLGGLSRYRGIPAATVATAMVAALRRDRPGTHIHENRAIAALAGTPGGA